MKYTAEQIKYSKTYQDIYMSRNFTDEEIVKILTNLLDLGEHVLFYGDLDSKLEDFFSWESSKQGDEYWRVINKWRYP